MKKIIISQTQKIFDYSKKILDEGYPEIFLYEEKGFREIIKFIKSQKSEGAIILDEFGNPNITYRKSGTWKVDTIFNYDVALCKKNNIYPQNLSDFLPEELIKKSSPTDEISLGKEGFSFEGSMLDKYFEERVKYFVNDDWAALESERITEGEHYKFSHRKLDKIKAKGYDLFKLSLENNNPITGVDYTKFNTLDDGGMLIWTKHSKIKLIKNEDESLDVYYLSNSKDNVELHYYHNGIINNVINHISLNKTTSRKISKKEIVISTIGMIIFILLTALTFTIILSPENTSAAVNIIFDKHTLTRPWIYLIWINFIITVFYSFIVMYMISFIYTGKKPDAKQMWTYFVAAQLKATTRFITGEAIIGTIVWGWYITKNNKIRVSSLVGSVATLSIIRAGFIFILTTPFMISGTIYASQIFNDLNSVSGATSINQTNIVLYYVLSWGGFVWALIHNCLVAGIIFIYPIHFIYNIIYTQLSLRKNPDRTISMMENREMSLLSMKRSYKTLFTKKDRIYRIMIMTILPVFLNAFEMMYIFKMTEDYMIHYEGLGAIIGDDVPSYNNFMQLSGLRLMSKSVHDFPIMTIMPGNGIGFIEYFMSFSNEAVFLHEHNVALIDNPDTLNTMLAFSNDFAEQTAFITRFFGTYLRKTISLLISLWVVFKLLRRRFA